MKKDDSDEEIDLIDQMERKMKIAKQPPPVVKGIRKPERGELLREKKERNKKKKSRSQLRF